MFRAKSLLKKAQSMPEGCSYLLYKEFMYKPWAKKFKNQNDMFVRLGVSDKPPLPRKEQVGYFIACGFVVPTHYYLHFNELPGSIFFNTVDQIRYFLYLYDNLSFSPCPATLDNVKDSELTQLGVVQEKIILEAWSNPARRNKLAKYYKLWSYEKQIVNLLIDPSKTKSDFQAYVDTIPSPYKKQIEFFFTDDVLKKIVDLKIFSAINKIERPNPSETPQAYEARITAFVVNLLNSGDSVENYIKRVVDVAEKKYLKTP